MDQSSNIFKEFQKAKEMLRGHHGSTQLKNIPEFTSSQLYQELANHDGIPLSLDLTVKTALNNIAAILSAESVILQFARFQEQIQKYAILPSKRTPENQRLQFYADKSVYEWIELLFSPQEHYFTINGKCFKKDDKKYNRGVFQNAIDTVVIEPDRVSENSLESLGITLDPDCQDLKDIFKKMHPLQYQDAEEKKHTIRIHEYEGKYIVFAAHKISYDATQPATKGEQRKEDVKAHMSVYSDIFSLIRREEHIIDGAQEKQQAYQDIKKKLLASIKEIDWNKKNYSVGVQQNIQEIITDIDQASSAKITADKIYHLYKITGKHSENDKNLLHASMKNFTQRIAQLIGISAHTQLHLLQLNDVLDDQNHTLEFFHAQIAMFLAEPHIPYEKFLVAFENYYRGKAGPRKEPFRTFDHQIRQCFGDLADLKIKDPATIVLKAKILLSLQKIRLRAYQFEHKIKLGTITSHDFIFDTSISTKYPELDKAFFGSINEYVNKIQGLGITDRSQKYMDTCISLLQQLKTLPDRESNIQALQNL